MRVSIVVPTYNGPRLRATVESLLASRLEGAETAELIVVDDGSRPPADLSGLVAPARFSVQLLRQTNAGPAAARNAGFRISTGDIVLFVDDDILVPPDLIEAHLAAHEQLGRAAICGRCVLPEPDGHRGLYLFLERLGGDPAQGAQEDFVRAEVVASGQISVRRAGFSSAGGVYRDDLKTPAAEEFELSMRLRSSGVPIFLATRIVALHCQPIDIDSIARQQYKHGLGCAEAATKCPETLQLPSLATIIDANRPPRRTDGGAGLAKRLLKSLVASSLARRALLALARLVERAAPATPLEQGLYRAVIGSHFVAGIRRGLQQFGPAPC